MLDINWKKVLLSCAIALVLIISGWILFRYLNTEQPLQTWFDDHPSLKLVSIEEGRQGTEVVVRFLEGERFSQDYLALDRFLKTIGPQYRIVIDGEQAFFHPFWKRHGAFVFEAYQQGRYTRITQWLDQLKTDGQVKDGYMQITPQGLFIYIDLRDEEDLFVRLPAVQLEGGEEDEN